MKKCGGFQNLPSESGDKRQETIEQVRFTLTGFVGFVAIAPIHHVINGA
jgi:hypothetical protein